LYVHEFSFRGGILDDFNNFKAHFFPGLYLSETQYSDQQTKRGRELPDVGKSSKYVGWEAAWGLANKAFFVTIGAHLVKATVPMHIAYLRDDCRNFSIYLPSVSYARSATYCKSVFKC
jgi:hypothetical protein